MKMFSCLGLAVGLAFVSASAQSKAASSETPLAQQPDPLPAAPLPARPAESPKSGEGQGIPLLPDDAPLKPGDKPTAIPPERLPLLPGEPILRPAPEERPRELPRYKLQLAMDAMRPVLPPLDTREDGASLASTIRVAVKEFKFSGNHVFSARQLAKVLLPFTGRVITSEELEEARVTLTKHYVEAGYITSGALLPDQDVARGIIRFQIVEGRLTQIQLQGNFWYRGWWLRNQLRRAAGRPVNFANLKAGLQLLRQDPTITRINAELMPGAQPGESVLEVKMKDAQPFRFGFTVSNNRPPSVGEGIGELYLADLNLTGHNDPIELRWGLVRWTKDGRINYTQFDNIGGTYAVPVSPWDTTLAVHASKNDSSIVDQAFAALGITSQTTAYGLALRQPLSRTLNNTVAVSLIADREHSQTFLLGQPFTLTPGAIDGKSDVFATRFALEWVNRSQVHVLALRSTFSLGLYGLGSTRSDSSSSSGITSGTGDGSAAASENPDSKFFSWLGQGQYVRRIFDTPAWRQKPDTFGFNMLRETVLVLRANAQLSDRPLLALEQFSMGGIQSVRGYRENELLRDNGVFASAEFRVPLWLAKDKSPIVSLAPFFDWGVGWNASKIEDKSRAIYSAGVGLLVNATQHAQLTIYWGHPFVDFHENKVSLQDYGIHFAISINAL